MGKTSRRLPARRPKPYHHGALRETLLKEAVRTIQREGVEALTLRAVGKKIGVSRTALYRHFADKSALLSAVAAEGFRMLRLELERASNARGGGREGFEAMGEAYVQFALAHSSHYRVMFGGVLRWKVPNPELETEGHGAFQVLVDALLAQQKSGAVRGDNPLLLAQFVWATVHGIAMLAIDDQLPEGTDVAELARFAVARLRTGIAR